MSARSTHQIIERQFQHWDRASSVLGVDPLATQAKEAAVQAAPVVCISRELGSGGRCVADGVAAALGCEVFDRQIIDHIAEDLHVQRELLDKLDESFRSNLERTVDAIMRGHHVVNEDQLHSLVRVVRGVAKRGAIVLVGRGANVILGREATLRVRLVAPPEHRANRLSRLESITTAEALKRIQKVDAERRRFLKHFFHVDPDDARINDLTIDTSRIPPERCAEILLAALRARGVEVNAHAKA